MKSARSVTPNSESSNGRTEVNKKVLAKEKTSPNKDVCSNKSSHQRASLIPILKLNYNETKGKDKKIEKSEKSTKITGHESRTKKDSRGCRKSYDDKSSRLVETCKEKQGQIKPSSQKERVRQMESPEPARRLTSDPLMFNKMIDSETTHEIQNGERKLCEVQTKTSRDFSKAFKNSKNNSLLDFKESAEIKQEKSYVVLKSKSAGAKAISSQRDLREQELASKVGSCVYQNDTFTVDKESVREPCSKSREDLKLGGSGDLPKLKTVKTQEDLKDLNQAESSKLMTQLKSEPTTDRSQRNKISRLNYRLLEFNRACQEHIQERQQLQMLLAKCNGKLQWNQVLIEQTRKLKAKMIVVQEINEKLVKEKAEIESRLAAQEKEIERLRILSRALLQTKLSFGGGIELTPTLGADLSLTETFIDNKILEEKNNSIGVLKMILNAMTDQEDLAQKQILMFKSKIEELEKAEKAEKDEKDEKEKEEAPKCIKGSIVCESFMSGKNYH